MKTNTVTQKKRLQGIELSPLEAMELVSHLQFLLLNSKSRMDYPEQQQVWERARQFTNMLAKKHGTSVLDYLTQVGF